MSKNQGIIKIYFESFIANIYTTKHFRAIGLIDVDIKFSYGIERVTLAYYRSSGTNNGKIYGLWYPIVGIKMKSGPFVEFTPYLNFILTKYTKDGLANKGWLAKSLFFSHPNLVKSNELNGFSNSKHYKELLMIGENLRDMYDGNGYYEYVNLHPYILNKIVTSPEIYIGNKYSQRENFENFIKDLVEQNS